MIKKKVLTLISSSYGGGAERLILDQINNHDSNKINYFVIALRKGNIESLFAKYQKYRCANSKLKFSFKTLFFLNRFIKKNKIKILHTHLIEADFYGFLLKLLNSKIKLISTRHISDDPFRKKLFWRIILNVMSSNVNKIIAVSNSVKRFTVKYEWIRPSKIQVIYNGIDTQIFKKQDVTKLRKDLGLSKKDFVVGIVGRLTEQKGHKYLFLAIAKLKKEIPHLKCLIIGEGELRKDFEEQVRKLGIKDRVIFLGFRKDMPKLYCAMNIFCLPSLFEGFGLVIAEAMSCNTPVIATDIDGVKEVISSKEGIMIKPKSSEEISKAILKVYAKESDIKKLSINGQRKVLENFDYRKSLKKIESVYDALY